MQAEPSGELIGGRYRVLSLLGRGGMGAAYRVRDEQQGRELALKRLLSSGEVGRTLSELFEREFHALSELAHPRIIEVYDYGVDEQGAFYTMELLGGQDLRELGKLDWKTACAVLRDVASSLAILHSRRMLHCDLSPRNVRCTAEGRAKLLDFGAMAWMGASRRVIGTPSYIAPEVAQLQTLDARTDLYGLGALAYWVLTGRAAYPARTIAEQHEAWRTPPPAPVELAPEVPLALSRLVMHCLQLNRSARPQSAGAVMEQLCAIASLPLAESEVAQAYLTTPTLVGRDSQLAQVRHALTRAAEGAAVFLVEGPSGGGRSRMLDACVREAKLLGWHVVRADLGDAVHGSYGVARALCEQLFALAPEPARAATRVHAPQLAHVLGSELAGAEPSAQPPDRQGALSALCDVIRSVARPLRLLIAVDDLDRIDESSASMLYTLAQNSSRLRLCLLCAHDSEGEGSAALDALSELGQRIALPPLSEQETEQLVRSVFADAGHVLTVARHLHAIARGNPRRLLELLEHLLTTGIARYEAGAFVLPERLREEDLPRSLSSALEGKMAALGADALELARALALTEPGELPLSRYGVLTGHADRGRTYRALDELVRVQMLEPEGERFRFVDATWREVLCGALEAADRAELHARLARAFEPGGTVARRALHRMEAGQSEAAIRVLLAQYLKDPLEPRDPLEDYVPGLLDLLERATRAAEALALPAPMRVELQMKTAGASQFTGDVARFTRVALPLLAQLERESGLAEYLALDATMDPAERLRTALARTQQRHESAPESGRGLPVPDAIRELARLCAMFTGAAAASLDASLLERVPSLLPLAPLSPAVAVIARYIDASRALNQGRALTSREMFLALLERLEQPDRAGLGELYYKSLKLGALYTIGLTEAIEGLPDASGRVAEHAHEPGHRVNAHRVRLISALMQCDFERAAEAQRRAELVMLQDGAQQRYPGTTARMELPVHVLAEDLAGVKQVVGRLAKAARSYPHYECLHEIGLSAHRRLQGDFAGALAHAERAFARVQTLRHRDWGVIAAFHVQALTDCGRAEEAAAIGAGYLQVCRRERLHGERWVAQNVVGALLAIGNVDAAAEIADRVAAEVEASGGRGLALGVPYELLARIAIARSDAVRFQQCAARCAEEYRLAHNPLLASRHERLLREAKEARLIGEAELPDPRERIERQLEIGLVETIVSRLQGFNDTESRARCALAILSEHAEIERGYLYRVHAGRATLLAALPQGDPSPQLCAAVEHWLERELQQEEATRFIAGPAATTVDVPSCKPEADSISATIGHAPKVIADAVGPLEPLLLAGGNGAHAVAAVRFRRSATRPSAALLGAIAAALDTDES